MQGFKFIPYTYQAIVCDFAMDVGDMFELTNTKNIKYKTFIMGSSWEFSGALTQTWTAKGENELNNSVSTKGPISQQLENITTNLIPKVRDEAVEQATDLLTKFNGGVVVKKDGELFIADNEDLDKAQRLWRWNINGLGYSHNGINGPYGLAMTMDGAIVANFITSGELSANRISGGTLKLGGINNTNGELQVVDSNGNEIAKIGKDGFVLSNGTKLIGNGGVLSNLQFTASGNGYYAGEFVWAGFMFDDYSGTQNMDLKFDVSIPENFTITEAYITLRHIPMETQLSTGSKVYGYVRNMKAYLADLSGTAYVSAVQDSEYQAALDGISYSEINNCFNNSNNSFTANVPSANNLKMTEIISKDIGSKINKNCRIRLASTNSIPSTAKACYEQSGFMYAFLNVYGYLQ